MATRSMGPIQRVIGKRREGRRVYITLHCGHEKLHNPQVPVPQSAHCVECPRVA